MCGADLELKGGVNGSEVLNSLATMNSVSLPNFTLLKKNPLLMLAKRARRLGEKGKRY